MGIGVMDKVRVDVDLSHWPIQGELWSWPVHM